jgi:uncharacterized protein
VQPCARAAEDSSDEPAEPAEPVRRVTDFDPLTLADWRKQVSDLYSDVRHIARDDPPAAWDQWVATRQGLFRDHPQSPVPSERRSAFRALHWPYQPALRFEVPVSPAPPVAPGAFPLELPNSGSEVLAFSRIGTVEIPFAAGPRRLSLFWMAGYSGGLFLPFRDATNGVETYGAGRYLLDGAKSADLGGDPVRGSLILDFNFAFHPSCAFDPKWACPLAPPENRLDLPVYAGERIA